MSCDRCTSVRILKISGKTSDCCSYMMPGETDFHLGYVPRDMNIGGGDYLEFDLCLNCGKVQGVFPVTGELDPEDESDEF